MGAKSVGRKEPTMERKTLESEAISKNSKIWTEPKHTESELKVPVIYYLSRNGQLEHPHLMEVPISSPQGMLCLKDVINRLDFLRGQGMANMYSWSTKRSYKNGFVWQDLSENDFIYPSTYGHDEYVLKGTQLIQPSLKFRSYETLSTPSSKSSTETNSSTMDADHSPAAIIKHSRDYKLYKANTCREFAGKAANASTQTEDKGSRQQRMDREKAEECEGNEARKFGENGWSLEGYGLADIRNQKIESERPSGRMKTSELLMQLVRCRIVSTSEEL